MDEALSLPLPATDAFPIIDPAPPDLRPVCDGVELFEELNRLYIFVSISKKMDAADM